MVATGFRIYAITFLAMGYDVTGSVYFTSCGDAKSSAIISSLRGIVLLLAFILIFPAIFGMNGVWMTSPCAETLTAIVTFVLIRRQVRKNKEEDTDEALYQFIKRVRLERSAWRLKVEKERSITEIGETYGYSSSNFATAFKKHLDISPADYRRSSEQMVEDSSFSHGMTLYD